MLTFVFSACTTTPYLFFLNTESFISSLPFIKYMPVSALLILHDSRCASPPSIIIPAHPCDSPSLSSYKSVSGISSSFAVKEIGKASVPSALSAPRTVISVNGDIYSGSVFVLSECEIWIFVPALIVRTTP